MTMPKLINTPDDNVQATRCSTWAGPTGKMGYDYKWQKNQQHGTLSLTTAVRTTNRNNELVTYALFEIEHDKKEHPPQSLIEQLKLAWLTHAKQSNFVIV